jgi:hypothetical protein
VTVHPHAAAVEQDRPAGAGGGHPVDGLPHRWWQRDQDHLAAFAAHAQHPVTVFFTQADPDVRSVEGPLLERLGWAPIHQESRSATVWSGLTFDGRPK